MRFSKEKQIATLREMPSGHSSEHVPGSTSTSGEALLLSVLLVTLFWHSNHLTLHLMELESQRPTRSGWDGNLRIRFPRLTFARTGWLSMASWKQFYQQQAIDLLSMTAFLVSVMRSNWKWVKMIHRSRWMRGWFSAQMIGTNARVLSSASLLIPWPGVTLPSCHIFVNGQDEAIISWGESTSINDGEIESYTVSRHRQYDLLHSILV